MRGAKDLRRYPASYLDSLVAEYNCFLLLFRLLRQISDAMPN